MVDYWMLLADDSVDVGGVVPNVDGDGRPNPAVSDPRCVQIVDALEGRARDGLLDMLRSSSPQVRVAKVAPANGEVRPHRGIWDADDVEVIGGTELEADGGWRVVSFEPLHTILGPQGELVAALAKEIDRAFDDQESEAVEAYQDEVERLYDGDGGPDWNRAQEAAVEALDAVGADSYWWGQIVSDMWGAELLALGARDLIGQTSDWTKRAYEVLTRPWRIAVKGQVHPDDAALAEAPR